ncbi:uncharacterized protein PG998_003478 [Apiospora kogelbergensis]|uniref:uncharacterized protein n=1 Tax=Apiospora kogelbergensis TaxID=1337665 RepID=UPI00312FA7D2
MYKLLTILILIALKLEKFLLAALLRVWEQSICTQASQHNVDLKGRSCLEYGPCPDDRNYLEKRCCINERCCLDERCYQDDRFDINLNGRSCSYTGEEYDDSGCDARMAEYNPETNKDEGCFNVPSVHDVESVSAHKRSIPVPGTKKNGVEGSPGDCARSGYNSDAGHEDHPKDTAGCHQDGYEACGLIRCSKENKAVDSEKLDPKILDSKLLDRIDGF